MKKVIRLTESDLHNLIQRSVLRVLHEENDTLLLQDIAQSIADKNEIIMSQGRNDIEVELRDGRLVYIEYNVVSDPYLEKGMESGDYDVPDDSDEIIDDYDIEVNDIVLYDYDDNEVTINDNGIVKEALLSVSQIDYDRYDIPNEEDYFYSED